MRLRDYASLDDQDPRKGQFAEQFANSVGATFLREHQVVWDKREIELRGRWNDFPARLKFGMSFGDFEWEMKAANPAGAEFHLRFDVTAVPAVGQFSGAVADDWDDGEVKTFIAKGLYLKTKGRESDATLAAYQALHESVRASIVTFMVSDNIHHLYTYQRGRLLLDIFRGALESPDPLNHVGRGAWLAGQVAWGLGQLDPTTLPAANQAVAPALIQKMKCGYCRTAYLWSQNRACPNCGAPPR